MDTLCSDRHSNIDPVIDDQWHIVSLRDLVEFLRSLNHHPCVAMLLSVLDNRDS